MISHRRRCFPFSQRRHYHHYVGSFGLRFYDALKYLSERFPSSPSSAASLSFTTRGSLARQASRCRATNMALLTAPPKDAHVIFLSNVVIVPATQEQQKARPFPAPTLRPFVPKKKLSSETISLRFCSSVGRSITPMASTSVVAFIFLSGLRFAYHHLRGSPFGHSDL